MQCPRNIRNFYHPPTNMILNNFRIIGSHKIHATICTRMSIRHLKKYGLDNSRRRILLALRSKAHASVSDLSDMVVSKMSTTTKIVYRLKDEGLVETYSCDDDARITRVVLTEKGNEMTNKINDLTSVVLEQSFDGLTPLQIEKMMESLRHIFNNLAR